MRLARFLILLLCLCLVGDAGCSGDSTPDIVVYCGVDQQYAGPIFAAFEAKTGISVAVQYDIESAKSVGLSGKLEAERDYPHADVWWGSEAFLTARLAQEGVLDRYVPADAADIVPQYKDAGGYWTGVALRARVIAVSVPPPPVAIRGLWDLTDPRLKDKIAMSRPTAGATGAHIAGLYVVWGIPKARSFFEKLHENGITLLGGNAEVADQVGAGTYWAGITDSDAITNTIANGGKVTMVVPDQNGQGTLAMPTTVALVKNGPHEEMAKELIDFLVSRGTEEKLIQMQYARWSVRSGPGSIKCLPVDYQKAAIVYPLAQQEASAILDDRE
ncbi:MAG TPA: extracellular solute-binding protein [Tepidisphaeraceae bacterium]|nr:extracellular solute-binding protein [Tepidisphaeraceae bacterium]